MDLILKDLSQDLYARETSDLKIMRTGLSILGSNTSSKSVIVSNGRSFDLTNVKSSNAFVLLPPTAEPTSGKRKGGEDPFAGIHDTAKLQKTHNCVVPSSSHYELSARTISLPTLSTILNKTQYTGQANEQNSKLEKRMTIDMLAVELQCSINEVVNGVRMIGGLILGENDGVTIVSEELRGEVFGEVLAVISELDMDLEKVVIRDVISGVRGDVSLEKEIIEHMLKLYAVDIEDLEASKSCSFVKLDPKKIAIFKASKILSSTSKKSYPLASFMSQWKFELPHQMTNYKLTDALLSKISLREFDKKVNDYTLVYYPSSSLPIAPAQRIGALFDRRGIWNKAELIPFLEDLIPLERKEELQKEIDLIILKYCLINKEGEIICKAGVGKTGI